MALSLSLCLALSVKTKVAPIAKRRTQSSLVSLNAYCLQSWFEGAGKTSAHNWELAAIDAQTSSFGATHDGRVTIQSNAVMAEVHQFYRTSPVLFDFYFALISKCQTNHMRVWCVLGVCLGLCKTLQTHTHPHIHQTSPAIRSTLPLLRAFSPFSVCGKCGKSFGLAFRVYSDLGLFDLELAAGGDVWCTTLCIYGYIYIYIDSFANDLIESGLRL